MCCKPRKVSLLGGWAGRWGLVGANRGVRRLREHHVTGLLLFPELVCTGHMATNDARSRAFHFPILTDSPGGRAITLADRLQEVTSVTCLILPFLCQCLWGVQVLRTCLISEDPIWFGSLGIDKLHVFIAYPAPDSRLPKLRPASLVLASCLVCCWL